MIDLTRLQLSWREDARVGLDSSEMLLQYRGVYKYYVNPELQIKCKAAEDLSGVCGLSFRQLYELILNQKLPLNDRVAKAKGDGVYFG